LRLSRRVKNTTLGWYSCMHDLQVITLTLLFLPELVISCWWQAETNVYFCTPPPAHMGQFARSVFILFWTHYTNIILFTILHLHYINEQFEIPEESWRGSKTFRNPCCWLFRSRVLRYE
jgi:hypothetical protein